MFAPGPIADSHVPLATNKRSDHEPLGRPVGARPRHQGRRTAAAALVRERLDRRLERQRYDQFKSLLNSEEMTEKNELSHRRFVVQQRQLQNACHLEQYAK